MPYYNHAWHLFSETERRAYGEAQREKRSQAWHAQWISRAGLKARLWTDKAITDFLGNPQAAGPIPAWPRASVLEAEQSPDFVAWMARRRAWLHARGKLVE